jgi:hypothetical protein
LLHLLHDAYLSLQYQNVNFQEGIQTYCCHSNTWQQFNPGAFAGHLKGCSTETVLKRKKALR